MPKTNHYALAGDIGGTNTRLALFDEPDVCNRVIEKDDVKAVYINQFRNVPFVEEHGLTAFSVMLNIYLKECGEADPNFKKHMDDGTLIIVACLACAGPIMNNACEFTNIDKEANVKFVIKGNDIAACEENGEQFVKVCKIVNDFVGQGYGALTLDHETEVVELSPGSAKMIDPLAPKVCVGAGTGLGECFLTIHSYQPSLGYECYPSEGGHVEYSPRSELEVELWQFLMHKFEGKGNHRISVERVVSGKGISNVYEFLAQKFPERKDEKVHAEFLSAGDMQGKVISDNATPGSLCDMALDIFAGAYGSEVGCAALKWIPRGGLYVTGGIIGKHLKAFPEKYLGPESPFMCAFNNKGRVSPILKDIPLFAVKGEDMGLRGARFVAMRELCKFK